VAAVRIVPVCKPSIAVSIGSAAAVIGKGSQVNKATFDPGTPIFGELNEELGELPEIVIHDFEWHGVEFGTSEEKSTDESESPSGGRRRKES
jgi:hypothetical protein